MMKLMKYIKGLVLVGAVLSGFVFRSVEQPKTIRNIQT